MTMPRVPRRLIAVAMSLVVSLLPTSVAWANHTANCSEYGFVTHQNGYVTERWSNHRYGIRATFEAQGLDLCLNPRAGEGSASTAWVAIQGPPSPYDIVQMGHGRCRPVGGGGCNSIMQDGYAWGRTSTSPGCAGYSNRAPTATWLGAWSAGGAYTILEEADHDYVLNSTKFGVTISSASICWTNDTGAIFVETHDYGDALGGDSTNTFNFTNKQFMTAPGGAWINLGDWCNARVNAGDPPFKCQGLNGATRYWTSR